MKQLHHNLRKHLPKLLLLFLCWRGALFGISIVADALLPYSPSFPYAEVLLPSYDLPRWLYSWANFDGVHYLTIAERGYIGTGLIQAFFPFFPYVLLHTLYVLSAGALNTLLTGLFISHFFTLILIVVWFYFVLDQSNEQIAWLSTVLLLIFPLSFFYGALYTESLFLAVVIGAFSAARKKIWWASALCVGIATATRLVGIFLIPALIVELFLQSAPAQLSRRALVHALQDVLSKRWRELCLILLGGVGLLAYMAFLYGEFRDPLYFLSVQKEFGAGREESVVLYPQVVWRAIKIVFALDPSSWRWYTSVLELFTGVGGLIVLLVAARNRQIRISHSLFSLLAFLLPTTTGTFSSMPRYVLVCFTIYLWLAHVLHSKRSWQLIVFGACGFLLAMNTLLFIQGYWVS